MQAYAEGWELLEKVDLVDNVTEVFDSWREGTVIRSWLLDLLVAALEEDTHLDQIAGYAEDSGEGRWTVEAGDRQRRADARHRRLAVRPLRLPPGRQPGDEGDRRDAQPVRRPRHHAPRRRAGGDAQPTRLTAPLYVAHLSLHDFRSYADRRRRAGAGRDGVHRPQRAGQDQPGRGDRLPLPADLAPGRDRGPAGPRRRRAGGGARGGGPRRADRGARGRAQPGPGQPGAGQQVAAPAGPRARRPGPHGDLLPRGPHPGQGRPVRPAAVPRRPAGAAHPAAGRHPCRLRPGAQAAQLPAQDRRRGPPRGSAAERRARDARGVGRAPRPHGAELLAARLALVDELRPYVGKAYETVARGASRDDAEIDLQALVRAAAGRPSAAPLEGRAARRGRAAPQRRARPRHLAGRPAPRRAAAHARPRSGDRRPGCR